MLIISIEFFQKSSLNSMNSLNLLKMFHGYVNVVIYGNLTIINHFYGNLTIIDQFLW